jgi:hypothetical protein
VLSTAKIADAQQRPFSRMNREFAPGPFYFLGKMAITPAEVVQKWGALAGI